ncbi:MAG: chitobiase/beta-hexosaminidase C-terminal domain-containing protein, partial [Eubacterium sp.]|nr:chitobiase/beta-hexosaminidase C-terminal domain-containing protein [Eubacterium sp.]
MPKAYSPNFEIRFFDNAGIKVSQGVLKSYSKNQINDLPRYSDEIVKDEWHRLRVVYDCVAGKRCFDIYLDGKKVNDEPIAAYWDDYYSQLVLNSIGNQEVYFDDIEMYYLPQSIDASVKFDHKTAMYTTEQTISLSTSRSSDQKIYYTLDGSYPDPVDNETATFEYNNTDKVKISTDTRLRAISGYKANIEGEEVFKAESVAYEETYSFQEKPVIAGDSICRESATYARVWFNNSIDGTIYYYVCSNRENPSAEDIAIESNKATETYSNGERKDGATLQDTVTQLIVTKNLETGPKYIYVVLKDKDGTLSNVLEYYAPYDVYYSDSFEGYYSNSNGGFSYYMNADNCKIVENVDSDHTKVYSLRSVENYKGFPNWLKYGTWIYEISFMATEDDSSFTIRFHDNAGIKVSQGVLKSYSRTTTSELPKYTDEIVKDEWHRLRMVYDCVAGKRCFDIYLDGKKVNDEPIAAYWDDYYSRLYLSADGNQEVYFDDIEMYYLPQSIDASVKFDHKTAMYIAEQTVSLSTSKSSDQTIYYTIDGSYPDPVENATSTFEYNDTDKIKVSTDTRLRAISGYKENVEGQEVFKAESVAYEETYSFQAEPILTGDGV